MASQQADLEKTGLGVGPGASGGDVEKPVPVSGGSHVDVPQMDEGMEDAEGTPAGPDRVVTDEELRILAVNIEGDWRTLAVYQLDVPMTEVESIIQQTPDRPAQRFCMLRSWKRRLERAATVQKLISAIDQHVGREKWGFLVGDGENGERQAEAEEQRPGDHEGLTHEEPAAGSEEQGEDALSTSSSVDSENLPPISSANEEHVTPESEDVQLQENNGGGAAGLQDHNDENWEPEGSGGLREDEEAHEGVLEDMERVSAVYTGFVEDKKDHFTSIGASVGNDMKKILTLDSENKKLKIEISKLKAMVKHPAKSSQFQHRQEDAATSTEEASVADPEEKQRSEDFKKLKHNYGKIMAHLKEVVEVNREWETFCRNKRDKHQSEIAEKNGVIRELQEKLATALSSSSDTNRQLDSILNDTENQASAIRIIKYRDESEKERQERQRAAAELESLRTELQSPEEIIKYRDESEKERQERQSTAAELESLRTELQRTQLLLIERSPEEIVKYRDESEKERQERQRAAAELESLRTELQSPEEIIKDRDESEKERQERQRAAAELESLRTELQRTQLLLIERSPEEIIKYRDESEKEHQERQRAAAELESLRTELQSPEEINKYSDESEKERQERQRAAAELEFLRTELHRTQLLLIERSPEEIIKYRDESEKERQERQRAAAELKFLRTELHRTQLLLIERSPEEIIKYRDESEKERQERQRAAAELESLRTELQSPEEYYGGAARYGDNRRGRKEAEPKGIPLMGPDEVAHYMSQDVSGWDDLH